MKAQPPSKTVPALRAIDDTAPLLDADEGPPVEIVNPAGKASLLLICEHASNRMPKALHDLGLEAEALQSHIAFDPGAEPVARLLSEKVDAPLILQRFSRLVYDCNRPPDVPSAMPERSEIYEIPGNRGLSPAEREERTAALYVPFHQAISDHLDRAMAMGRYPAIVTVHSFTPMFHGQQREVELGLLHDHDTRLADEMLHLAGDADAVIRRNEPYGPKDGVTHTLIKHALPRGLLNVMLEIRNDLIRDRDGQARVSADLARMVSQAFDRLSRSGKTEKRQAAR